MSWLVGTFRTASKAWQRLEKEDDQEEGETAPLSCTDVQGTALAFSRDSMLPPSHPPYSSTKPSELPRRIFHPSMRPPIVVRKDSVCYNTQHREDKVGFRKETK
ncbi:unnamed protein product [Hydatigera taeniaeformis]|uniref:Secreted protein n=1 Tax=Hydatigena taeniaeformis TaxID=6205 RepID=A0A0R3X800_HYDTA|nr:unnamed protein product [Hydatigera taeniaeformis]